MGKFNPGTRSDVRSHPAATKNYGGGLAFRMDPELELYTRVSASLIEDKFYTSSAEELQAIRDLIHQCDREYVLALASYARNKMHLRSAPIVLLAEAASMQEEDREPKPEVRRYTPEIIRRPDELMEVVSYWVRFIGGGSKRNFPNALKRGLADALEQFDEYQLAKYDRRKQVTLKDVINIVHPRPKTRERAELYRRVLDGKLKTPETWEVHISREGASAASWNEAAKKMGIMALLRNLRNFEEHGALGAIEIALKRFNDPKAVMQSKLLPFRWYQAYHNVSSPKLEEALTQALELSIANIEPWEGSTVIICDTSGSMEANISRRSSIKFIEVAALLGAMAAHLSTDYRVGVFATEFRWVCLEDNAPILENMKRIRYQDVGYSSNAYMALEQMIQEGLHADRIILLSDMQVYDSEAVDQPHGSTDMGESFANSWERYRRLVNDRARLYSIDLGGYGTAQIPPNDPSCVLIAGWSDEVLRYIPAHEEGPQIVSELRRGRGPKGS